MHTSATAHADASSPPSHLVTTMRSASSIIPRLIPCRPSPAYWHPGGMGVMRGSPQKLRL
eukprot:scaffold267028_cov40-Tisochrysis_lutea.AAC.2